MFLLTTNSGFLANMVGEQRTPPGNHVPGSATRNQFVVLRKTKVHAQRGRVLRLIGISRAVFGLGPAPGDNFEFIALPSVFLLNAWASATQGTMSLFLHETADWIPIASDVGWPVVVCPDCGITLSPICKRRAERSFDMVVLRYVCERCEFETFRAAKGD